MTRRSHPRTAVVAAIVLALAVAGPASAASAGHGVTDSVTVNETLSLFVDTTAMSYNGHGGVGLDPGATSTGQGMHVIAGANRPWVLTATGTDLWSPNGHMIPLTNRTVSIDGIPYGFTSGMTLLQASSGPIDTNLYWSLTIPADAAGGEYSGSLTLTLTAP